MAKLTTVARNVPLSTQAIAQIRELIDTGEWQVGARIPGEHELVTLLGMSRNSVREALRSLVHSGLLESRVGDGTYVCASSELEVALQRRADSNRSEDVFEVRLMIERTAAQLAATRASESTLAQLKTALENRDRSTDYAGYADSDHAFHALVMEGAGNPLLTELYSSLQTSASFHLADSAAVARDYAEFFELNAAVNEKHDDLLRAITDRDPQRAGDAALELVEEARELYRSNSSRPKGRATR